MEQGISECRVSLRRKNLEGVQNEKRSLMIFNNHWNHEITNSNNIYRDF